MNYNQALAYIEFLKLHGSQPGLEAVEALVRHLGDPQNKISVIHVAGTNGKGSVSSYIANILQKAGYQVGLYTSPKMEDVRETIRINGDYMEKEHLIQGLKRMEEAIQGVLEEGIRHPTEFEVMTALAYYHFYEQGCDFAVIETGLGGKGDATNVVDKTLCCVLTAIGMDHIQYLGDTLEEIATEKAGIIKEGSAVVVYNQDDRVVQVMRDTCELRKAHMRIADYHQAKVIELSVHEQVYDYGNLHKIRIRLLGEHQIGNSATAIECIYALREKGYMITDTALREGLLTTNWPYRMEVICHQPTIVVDGAHNHQAAKTLRQAIESYFGDKSIIMVFGVFGDKDYHKILAELGPLADSIITLEPNHERALPSTTTLEVAKMYCEDVIDGCNVQGAVPLALEKAGEDGIIIALGSLSYLPAFKKEVKRLVKGRP